MDWKIIILNKKKKIAPQHILYPTCYGCLQELNEMPHVFGKVESGYQLFDLGIFFGGGGGEGFELMIRGEVVKMLK